MSGLLRPTSRVLILALELTLSGAALLLVGGTALADSTTQVTNTATQDVSGGTTVVSSDSQNQVQTVSGQTVIGDSSNGSSNTSAGVAGGSTGGTAVSQSQAADPTASSQSASPLAAADPTAAAPTAVITPDVSATPTSAVAAAMAKTSQDSVVVSTPGAAGPAWRSGYIHFATISSESTAPELAANALPSSPEPAKSPIKSTGLFGQLADHLATIVVPGHTRFNAMLPVGLTTLIGVIILTLLLSDLIIRSFGQTMRRSGFTHAARSDLPTTSFAPPHLLGYVPAWGRAT